MTIAQRSARRNCVQLRQGSERSSLSSDCGWHSARSRRARSWTGRSGCGPARCACPWFVLHPTGSLRALEVELRRAVADSATARQVALERAIRARSRIAENEAHATIAAPDLGRAAVLLDGLALVEYVDVDGKLYALTLVSETLALHELDPNVTNELEWLRFAYGRLAAGRLTADQRAANRRNAETSAAALETGLLSPLLQTIGDAPLVIVPTGALHALPWGALPALRATVLTGKTATAEATLAALDGAALAHLACHGHFRADSPLFSSRARRRAAQRLRAAEPATCPRDRRPLRLRPRTLPAASRRRAARPRSCTPRHGHANGRRERRACAGR